MGLFDFWRGRKISLTDGAFWSAFFNGESWSGESAGPAASLQLSAWWACVRLISQTVASLPIHLYERQENGDRKPRPDHPLYELLHDSPNADQTAVEFWEAAIASLCIHGNAFAEKRMQGRKLIALDPMPPDATSIRRRSDGSKVYTYTDRGKRYELPEDRVFHIRGWGDGDVGLSPVGYARQTLGIAIATEKAAGRSFAQGMRASGFFTAPPNVRMTLEQREQFKQRFIDPYVGGDASAKIGLLEGGFDFKPIQMSNEDAELLMSRRFNVEEICRWLGVPPLMIGHHSQGATMWGTGVEQIMLGWLQLGLRPYLTRVEQAVRKRLMLPEERRVLKAEFAVEGLLRADSAGRAAFYSTMVQNGIFSRNRVRALENEPKDPSPLADALTVQSNLVPLAQLGQGDGNGGSGAPIDQQAREVLRNWLLSDLNQEIEARAKEMVRQLMANQPPNQIEG